MPNERLSLSVDLTTTGESSANALSQALQRVVDVAAKSKSSIAEPSKTGFEEFPEKLRQFVEAPLQSAQGAIAEFSKGFGAIGIAAGGAIGLLAAFGTASFSASRALGDLAISNQNISIKLGLSTREVGLFSFAAKAAGSDIGVMDSFMRKLSQGLADGGDEGKKAASALASLSIRTREANGEIRPMSEIFSQIGDAMAGMTSTAERNALAIKLGGRAALEAIPMFVSLSESSKRFSDMHLGISDEEQARLVSIAHDVHDLDALWGQAKRHMEEGISGTITLKILKQFIEAADQVGTGNSGIARTTSAGLFGGVVGAAGGFMFGGVGAVPGAAIGAAGGIAIQQGSDAATGAISSAYGKYFGPVDGPNAPSAPRNPSFLIQSEHLRDIDNGRKVQASYGASRSNTKEGIDSRISDLEKKNDASNALLAPGSGIGEAAARQASDSINANQRIIDSLRAQLKDIEENVAAAKKLSDLRKEGHTFYTLGTGKNQTVITDDEMMKYNMAGTAEARKLNPPSLDGPDNWARVDSFDRSSADLDALNHRDFLKIPKMQAEAGSEWFKDASHRDDLAMRGIDDTANRKARIAGIGAQPDEELAVAAKQRDIRMQAIADDQATLLLSKDRYDITDKMYALEQKAQDAQLEYNEKVAEQVAKQAEQFKSISGSFFDSITSGKSKDISGFFIGQLKDLGKTGFENLAKIYEPSIMAAIPHVKDPDSFLGKLTTGMPFGPQSINPMKTATDANTLATQDNTTAIQNMQRAAVGGPSAGGGSTGTLSPGVLASLGSDLPMMRTISTGLPSGIADTTGNPDLPSGIISEIDPNQNYGTATPNYSSAKPMIGTAQGDLMAGAAVIGGVFSAIKGFAGSGSGGVQGKLDGAGALVGSASVIMSMIPAIASSIPIVGSIVAAAMPLIGSLFPNGPAARENQISHELTNATYQAPTALNETMSTSGTYQDFDARGNLRNSNFSATPQVLDPYTYWGPHNTPYQAPGSVTSPYGAPVTPAAPTVTHVYQAGAIQTIDAGSFDDLISRSSTAVGEAVVTHIQSGGAGHLINTIGNAMY